MAGRPNQPLRVHMAIEATGEREPETIYVDFYASTDTQITESDYYLGQINLGLTVNTWMMVTLECMLPVDIPAGTYYVGWIIDPANINDETNEVNNAAFNDAAVLTVVGATGSVIYVDGDALGANDGSNWWNAYHHLQDALAQAATGSEIRVAGGIYTPDRGAGVTAGDRQATFHLKTGVSIAGGYAGAGAPIPDARDIDDRPTILSGDLKGDDRAVADPCALWLEPSRMDNSRHVVTAIDMGRTAVLDGLWITGGCADGWFDGIEIPSTSQGAGIYVSGGGPRLRRCVLVGNWASAEGGALYAMDSRPELLCCELGENAAGFVSAENRGAGGAVFITNGSLSAANCVLYANHAVVQAGAIYALDAEVVLTNCTIAGNRQDRSPGALVCESSKDPAEYEVTVVNSILWNDGGQIDCLGDATVTVTYSDVRGGWPGVGNIDADPQFADGDDLRLTDSSPCIDAGATAALPEDVTDLDGDGDVTEPLPLDCDGKGRLDGKAVDIGAYETRPPEGHSTE